MWHTQMSILAGRMDGFNSDKTSSLWKREVIIVDGVHQVTIMKIDKEKSIGKIY